MHRFLSLGLKSRITARKRANPGHSLQRFPISAPELAITAAPDHFPWISLQTNGVRHGAAAGECRMGRDFGRRSRPWLRERGACRAAVGGKAPQVRTGPKSLPADRVGRRDSSNPSGRLGRGNTALPAGRLGRGDSSNPAGRLGMDQSDEPEGQVAWKEAGVF